MLLQHVSGGFEFLQRNGIFDFLAIEWRHNTTYTKVWLRFLREHHRTKHCICASFVTSFCPASRSEKPGRCLKIWPLMYNTPLSFFFLYPNPPSQRVAVLFSPSLSVALPGWDFFHSYSARSFVQEHGTRRDSAACI